MSISLTAVGTAARSVVVVAISAVVIKAGVQVPGSDKPVVKDAAWVSPAGAAHRPNPVPLAADAVTLGDSLFRRDCERCHGSAGRGDGPMITGLPLRPADLVSRQVQSQTDGAIFWKISQGRGDMPGTRQTLSDDERWAVVDYIRSLSLKR